MATDRLSYFGEAELMKTSTVIRFVLNISIGAAMLAGCDASQSITAPGAIPHDQPGGVRADGGKSWM